MGWLVFLCQQEYFIIFSFLLCAFKMIMIKGIAYVQCQKWVIKLSLKDKHFWVFYVMWIELVLFKEDRETLFWHNIFTFLINQQKEFRKSIKQILTKKY